MWSKMSGDGNSVVDVETWLHFISQTKIKRIVIFIKLFNGRFCLVEEEIISIENAICGVPESNDTLLKNNQNFNTR